MSPRKKLRLIVPEGVSTPLSLLSITQECHKRGLEGELWDPRYLHVPKDLIGTMTLTPSGGLPPEEVASGAVHIGATSSGKQVVVLDGVEAVRLIELANLLGIKEFRVLTKGEIQTHCTAAN